MVAFDPELWRLRALRRHKQVLGSGKVPPEEACRRHDRDLVAIKGLAQLLDWCEKRNIEVIFSRKQGGVYLWEDKKIKLNGRLQPEKQLHVALHECGHHLIGMKDRHERFGMGYSQDDPAITRTFHHRCDILDEEFDAWHRGRRLATRLGIELEKDRYDVTRTEMLRTYLKWALRLKGYSVNDDDDDEKPVA